MTYLSKEAAVRAANVKHLISLLSASGKPLAEGSAQAAVRALHGRGGSGSFFLDNAAKIPGAISGLLSKFSPGAKAVGAKPALGARMTSAIEDSLAKYREVTHNVDMRAGNHLSNKLQNTPLRNLFVDKQTFRMAPQPGVADELLEIELPGLSVPLNKARRVALPLVGSLTVATGMGKMYENMQNKPKAAQQAAQIGGEDMSATNLTAQGNLPAQPKLRYDERGERLASLTAQAVEMLKVAAVEGRQIRLENEKLAQENERLQMQLVAKVRSSKAVKLANLMKDKGMIKKSNIEAKVDELMDMPEEAFEILAEAVGNAQFAKTASHREEGVDSLAFLADGATSESKRRKTLADELTDR